MAARAGYPDQAHMPREVRRLTGTTPAPIPPPPPPRRHAPLPSAPSGPRVYVPMRLIANSSGCELLFTLFREPNMSDAQFASDAGFVQRDLNGLKRLLEK